MAGHSTAAPVYSTLLDSLTTFPVRHAILQPRRSAKSSGETKPDETVMCCARTGLGISTQRFRRKDEGGTDLRKPAAGGRAGGSILRNLFRRSRFQGIDTPSGNHCLRFSPETGCQRRPPRQAVRCQRERPRVDLRTGHLPSDKLVSPVVRRAAVNNGSFCRFWRSQWRFVLCLADSSI
jgi:hypothetical protein